MKVVAEAPPLSRRGPVKIERAIDLVFTVTATCARGLHAFNTWAFDRAERRSTRIQTTEQLGVKVSAQASEAIRQHAATGCVQVPKVSVNDGDHIFDIPSTFS